MKKTSGLSLWSGLMIAWWVVLPPVASCQPVIASISGDLIKGERVTVTGSAFGTKDRAEPLKYDFFEKTGTTLSNEGWKVPPGPQPSFAPEYSSEGNRMDGQHHVRCMYRYNQDYSEDSQVYSSFYYDGTPAPLSSVYITFYYKRTHQAGPATDWHSWFRITNDGQDGIGLAPYLQHVFRLENSGSKREATVIFGFDNAPVYAHDNPFPPLEQWIRFEGYYEKAAGDPQEGILMEWVWKGTDTDQFELINNLQNVHTDSPGSSARWNDIIFGGRCDLSPLGSPPDQSMVYYSEYDDIYIDKTRARIEIGNRPTWEACTHREIQIPETWSATSIAFRSNQGTFKSGEPVYIYVVDDQGVPSDGLQAAFRESSPISAPANIQVLSL